MSNPADPNRSTRMYRAATPVEEEDIHPGAIVGSGRFKIFGIIGRGKMASVFRARDLRRNADIALKVLARKFVGHQSHERRFDNEARLAGRLQGHRNVVAPIESGRLDDCAGRMFLAMELVNGPTLTDLVSMNGPLGVEDACMYMRDVARALRDMHQSGVVHRDIKPDTVIVVELQGERVAKLLDFGLAADIGAGADARMTRLGERPGTPRYMSPEQAWDAPAHPVFDIYALGVTFFEILTGHAPFFELDDTELINRKCDLNKPAPSIKGRRQDLPPRLDILIDACLEPVAKKRLPSINSFLKRLDSISEAFGGGGMSPRTRQQTSMVGQARTIAPKKRKSRLPEMIAEAAARKQQQQFGGGSASIGPDAPTPNPDRMMGQQPAQPRIVVGHQGHPAAGHPPQAAPGRHAPHAAGPGSGSSPIMPPRSGSSQVQVNPVIPPSASQTPPSGNIPFHPSVDDLRAAPRAGNAPGRKRVITNNRAIVIGLIVGAVLSALLVIGLWLWLMVKK